MSRHIEIYGKIVSVEDNSVTIDCHIDVGIVERRLFDWSFPRSGYGLFKHNIVKIVIESGSGYVQMTVTDAPHEKEILDLFKIKENDRI